MYAIWKIRILSRCSASAQSRPLKNSPKNMENYAAMLPETFLTTIKMRRNVWIIHTWACGIPSHPNSLIRLLTYVCKITRNLAIKKYHANTPFKRNSCDEVALSEPEGCLAAPDSAEAELSAQELTEALNRFLSMLDRENRILFVRRYWYADSISDLVEQFGMSNRNISLRLFRTREKLRSHLVQEGVLLWSRK